MIRGGMTAIPLATPIADHQGTAELEALAGSRKCGARKRDRAQIVLQAGSGIGSRAIARDVGCTPGTASKGRMRFASHRTAELSETDDRGAEPKYGPEHGKRILALLDVKRRQQSRGAIAFIVMGLPDQARPFGSFR